MSRAPNHPIRIHPSLKMLYKLAASVDGAQSLAGWFKGLADKRVEELIREERMPSQEEANLSD